MNIERLCGAIAALVVLCGTPVFASGGETAPVGAMSDTGIRKDMIVAALNEAFKKVDDEQASLAGKMTGGAGGFGSGLF